MDRQVAVADSARANEFVHDGVHEIAGDVACKRVFMVNICCLGLPGQGESVLIDAGSAAMAHLASRR